MDNHDYLNNPEIPSVQRSVGRPALVEMFPPGIAMSKVIRNMTIVEAHGKQGYRLSEVAELLGIHYTTVRNIVNQQNI